MNTPTKYIQHVRHLTSPFPANPKHLAGYFLLFEPTPGELWQGEIIKSLPARSQVALQRMSWVTGHDTDTVLVAIGAVEMQGALFASDAQMRAAYQTVLHPLVTKGLSVSPDDFKGGVTTSAPGPVSLREFVAKAGSGE